MVFKVQDKIAKWKINNWGTVSTDVSIIERKQCRNSLIVELPTKSNFR